MYLLHLVSSPHIHDQALGDRQDAPGAYTRPTQPRPPRAPGRINSLPGQAGGTGDASRPVEEGEVALFLYYH